MYAQPLMNGSVNGHGLMVARDLERQRLRISKTLQLGFPKLGQIVRMGTGLYVVLAARPGMFKSTLAWIWASNLATQGKKVLWIGLEMGSGQMATMFLSRKTGILRQAIENHDRGERPLPNELLAQLEYEEEKGLPETLVFHTQGANLTEILDSMNKVPFDAVFLDYLQLVRIGRVPMKEYDRVTEASMALAAYAHQRNVLVLALSQMNRAVEFIAGSGPRRLPTLADLKGSGQIEQDADAVLFLAQDEFRADRNLLEPLLICQKNRYGPTGIVHLKARPEIAFIEEVNRDPLVLK